MVHRVQCPHCHAEFNASQEQIGQRAKCSKCGQAFVVSRDASSQPDDPLTDLQAQLNEGPPLDGNAYDLHFFATHKSKVLSKNSLPRGV